MFIVPNRIFYIPEIEDLIFDYLDPVEDLKNVAAISHHYYDNIGQNDEYTEIRNFCKSKKNMINYI